MRRLNIESDSWIHNLYYNLCSTCPCKSTCNRWHNYCNQYYRRHHHCQEIWL